MLAKFTSVLVALGPWGLLLLSVIDSAGIPIAVGVDALLLFLSARRSATAPLYAALAVLGSTAGTMVLFFVARRGGQRYLDRMTGGSKGERFRRWFRRYGLLTVFVPALVPIPMPMKAFVICAGVFGSPPSWFLAVVLVARILRYGAEAYLGVELGEHSVGYLRAHAGDLAILAIALFVTLYLLVRWRGSR